MLHFCAHSLFQNNLQNIKQNLKPKTKAEYDHLRACFCTDLFGLLNCCDQFSVSSQGQCY